MTHSEFSRKGGLSGRGPSKARSSRQMRKAANVRWNKVKLSKLNTTTTPEI